MSESNYDQFTTPFIELYKQLDIPDTNPIAAKPMKFDKSMYSDNVRFNIYKINITMRGLTLSYLNDNNIDYIVYYPNLLIRRKQATLKNKADCR